jgi:Tfp pilus assembly protein PilO
MAAMSQRDRRALILLGVALALFLVLQLDMFKPSSAGPAASDAALDALEQRLQLAQVQARQRPLTEAELNAAQKRLDKVESRLLESADSALAQAEMRSLVGQLLDGEGIPLRASRFGAVKLEQDRYVQVPLVVEFTCGIEQMVNLMAAAANSSMLLATRDIRIRPDKAEVKSIAVTMTIAGFLPLERAPELAEKAAGASRQQRK